MILSYWGIFQMFFSIFFFFALWSIFGSCKGEALRDGQVEKVTRQRSARPEVRIRHQKKETSSCIREINCKVLCTFQSCSTLASPESSWEDDWQRAEASRYYRSKVATEWEEAETVQTGRKWCGGMWEIRLSLPDGWRPKWESGGQIQSFQK